MIVALVMVVSSAVLACGGGNRVMAAYLDSHAEELTRPLSVDESTVRFVVEPGTPARLIGQNLQEANLIGDDFLFEAYVRVNGLSNRLAAGTFLLSPSMTLVEIVEKLQQANAESIRLTIPEGWRIGQIVDRLAELEIFDEVLISAYRQQVESGDLSSIDASRYPFLQQRPAGTSLEGYLFPDTFEIPAVDPTVADILERQLDGFATKVLPLYDAAVAAGDTDLDLYTVLILASIVEREAVVAEERPAIAGVYLNRLAKGIKLEADPTVQYALGYQPESDQWWKTPIFLEEYGTVDSPYNTYLYPGLPPGPIANPGVSSIQAVLHPEKHDFIYFVALPDEGGRHVFAETFAEHEVNVRNYLGQ